MCEDVEQNNIKTVTVTKMSLRTGLNKLVKDLKPHVYHANFISAFKHNCW